MFSVAVCPSAEMTNVYPSKVTVEMPPMPSGPVHDWPGTPDAVAPFTSAMMAHAPFGSVEIRSELTPLLQTRFPLTASVNGW